MTFDLGPFHLYRVEKSGALCVSLKHLEEWPCGWEYGWKDESRGVTRPAIEFRIGKLQIFYFERYKKGFELWFLGFWWIM